MLFKFKDTFAKHILPTFWLVSNSMCQIVSYHKDQLDSHLNADRKLMINSFMPLKTDWQYELSKSEVYDLGFSSESHSELNTSFAVMRKHALDVD